MRQGGKQRIVQLLSVLLDVIMVRVRRQTLVIASVTGLAICATFAMMAGRTLIVIQVRTMLTFRLIYVITIEFSGLQGGLPKWDLCECPRNM